MVDDMVEAFDRGETGLKTYVVTGREEPKLLKDALVEYGKTFSPKLPVKSDAAMLHDFTK